MTETIQSIPLDQIQPSRYQSRCAFDEESLQSLAESMKQEGLLEPIIVRSIADCGLRIADSAEPAAESGSSNQRSSIINQQFELVSGERRVRAARMLGWETIPARVIQVISEGEAAAKWLMDNLQRKGLDMFEEAKAFRALHQADPEYWTIEKIAQTMGRSQEDISQALALLVKEPSAV
jgi:ParB family chromosome partitioning protein